MAFKSVLTSELRSVSLENKMGMGCDLLAFEEQGVKTNSSINCGVEPYLSSLRIAADESGCNSVVLAVSTKLPCREMRAALLAALVQPRSRVALSGATLPISPVYESGSLMYLNTQRPKLLGELSSHELLEADNRNGVLSPTLVRNTSVRQFVFVDQPSCIGCRARPRT